MRELNAAAGDALRIENAFLSGVRANIEQYKGTHLRGDEWRTVEEDDGDALRAMMASKRMYDRSLLGRMPHNRRTVLSGFERRFLFWKKQTGAAIVSVMSPLADLLEAEGDPGSVGLNELTEHLRKIAPDPKVPHVIGVCSTTGFSDEARAARHEYPNVTLVLIEPDKQGGWRVSAGEETPQFVRKMFDPEDAEQKTDRVRQEVQRRSADLLTGGLGSDSLAESLNLPREFVDAALDRIATADPELRVSKSSSGKLLYRGAPVMAKEKTSMSFVDRIKELFGKEGDEGDKINILSERRAALAQRRDRLYEEIGKLETREAELIEQGRKNTSTVVRRRLAAQVAQLRKDIARQNTTANMLNQQINIIATDIHNLTLIKQGEVASLPDTEELTENAVKAEEMLETLKADADLVTSLETGIGEVLTSDEEKDILAEFDAPQPAEAQPETATTASKARTETPVEDDVISEFDAPADDASRRKEKADPEAT